VGKLKKEKKPKIPIVYKKQQQQNGQSKIDREILITGKI
jgi:hypothetical protein